MATPAAPDRSASADHPPRVRMSGIAKRYGLLTAISHADFAVQPGSVHALVGENGAGKSTLIKILCGAETPQDGTIEIDGHPVSIDSTDDAMALGVATVYQEPQLFGDLTVTENVFAGRELRRAGFIDWRRQWREVVELLRLIGLPESYATVPVSELSIASQQQVSIAKALAQDASVLILDEPSAILTDSEIDVLFGIVRRLRDRGVAVIYISHRLDELFRIADTVTIMRDGRTTGTYPMATMSVRSIAEEMVGGVEIGLRRDRVASAGTPVLELAELERSGSFHDVALSVGVGEIVAMYGLVGSGASDVAAVVYGMRRATSGRIRLNGTEVRPRSSRHAQRMGIALLPANRKTQAMFSFQSIAFNIGVGHISLLSRLGLWFDRARERRIALSMIERLSVVTPDERQPIGAMSGGNAQKVVLARQLVQRPRLLILEEPTQGVDIGAKEEIHSIVSALADEGSGVLVVTTDLAEALRIADRVVVIRDGRTVAEFTGDASQVDVLSAAAGEASLGGDEA